MKQHLYLGLLFFFLGACHSQQPLNEAEQFNNDAIDGERAGTLVFIEVDDGDQFISTFDLQTKEVNRFFTAPENGWVSQIDVAPDNEQLLMAYAPPPPEGEIQFGYTAIYLTFWDETAVPTPFIQKQHPKAVLFNPVWSPDGQSVYYSHLIPDEADAHQFELYLERHSVKTAETFMIAKDGIWPRISPDSEKLVYVTVDPQSLGNALWLSNGDGSDAVQLVSEVQFKVVDVPMFSPDGNWVYFTAAEKPETAVKWWEALLGIQSASAHNIPSDWYRLPTSGGQPEQLTMIQETGIYGDFSPDGKFIGFATFNGLYIMQPDGSELEKILEVGATSALSWIP